MPKAICMTFPRTPTGGRPELAPGFGQDPRGLFKTCRGFPHSVSRYARVYLHDFPKDSPRQLPKNAPPGFGKGPPRTLQDFPPGLPQVSRPRMSPGFGQGSPMTLQDFSPGLPQGSRPRESPGFSQDPPRSLPNLTEELLKELSKTPHAI